MTIPTKKSMNGKTMMPIMTVIDVKQICREGKCGCESKSSFRELAIIHCSIQAQTWASTIKTDSFSFPM